MSEFTVNQWASNDEQKRSDDSLTPEIVANLKELAENLQVLRDYLNSPININIAFRPKWWELKQGRSGKSQHCLGKAADIVCKDFTPKEVHATIKLLIKDGKMSQGGLGSYNSFTHYDIRKTKARW